MKKTDKCRSCILENYASPRFCLRLRISFGSVRIFSSASVFSFSCRAAMAFFVRTVLFFEFFSSVFAVAFAVLSSLPVPSPLLVLTSVLSAPETENMPIEVEILLL